MPEVAEQLLDLLGALDEASQLCTSGMLAPVLPGLEVEGVGDVGLPIGPLQAQQLIEQAVQAPYGRGEETIVDTDVRRVWQIEPKRFSIHNPEWDEFIAEMVDAVTHAFGIDQQVDWDLYKLLIYEAGSFFAPHRDSEKVDGMFATLVACLPSRHEGGTLLVSHDGETKAIDFGGANGAYNMQYAAFYTDCKHEVEPVTSGYRVSRVYNLKVAKRKRQPSAPRNRDNVALAASLLSELFADASRHKVAIRLSHEYSEAGLNLDTLGAAAYRRLLQHCIEALQALTDTPVTIPDHWAQDIEINHNCEDCQELQRFLRDPERRMHRFRVRKDRRQHLHRQIDSHGCDMTHVTERQGSPQTLVCTKTRASYERRQRQFEADTELLVELRDMAGA